MTQMQFNVIFHCDFKETGARPMLLNGQALALLQFVLTSNRSGLDSNTSNRPGPGEHGYNMITIGMFKVEEFS